MPRLATYIGLNTLGILLFAGLLFNSWVLHIPIIGTFCLFGTLLSIGALIGPTIHPRGSMWERLALGSIIAICAHAVISCVFYYGAEVNSMTLTIALGILLVGASLIGWRRAEECEDHSLNEFTWQTWLLALITGLVLIIWWQTVAHITVSEAIRSIWLIVSPIHLILIFLATACISTLLIHASSRLAIGLLSVLLLSITGIASTVFVHGYGFDPFIHTATMAHIAEFGTITPKPLYYIGAYMIELTAHLLGDINLLHLDRWLLPIAISITAPITAAIAIRQGSLTAGSILALLFLPFSAFIVTTPQGLSYAITLLIILLSIPALRHNAIPYKTLWLLCFTTIAIHPLAGIPAAIYLILVHLATTQYLNTPQRITVLSILAPLASMSIPAVFLFQSQLSGNAITFTPQRLFDINAWMLPTFWDRQFTFWLDGAYTLIENMWWILLILAVFGTFALARLAKQKAIWIPVLMAIICLINYILLATTLEFTFLIEYERLNYAHRLLTLSALFCLPGIMFGLHAWFTRSRTIPPLADVVIVTLLACITTASAYAAYPRHDGYARSSGFNVSTADFDVVWAIDDYANMQPYLALANQAVSAAALQTFGFAHYYDNDIFYYPIPTGGEMYELYLSLVEEEVDQEVIDEAFNATDAEIIFFVVNDYWWGSERIIEEAKRTTDEWFAIGDQNVITVFVYRR